MGERTGGKHRTCALVEILARRIRAQGRSAEIRHLHAHLPRVLTTPTVPAER
jgi:UPF0042 nucleotide-binding protein